ncbi:amino acid adenylation domain-containing protein [Actinomadura sp. 9N215]|uniref:amino acid adenylation domain-containing protein n=1 Tax=Actinomadura sp. 9N215 TaxID=3375150 RepID=UPI00378D14EB
MTAFDLTAQPQGGAIEDIYPLTGLQQGMLFHSRLTPGTGMYWIWMGLPLHGELDLAVLRQAWELVFTRHEVLRTGVVWEQVPVPVAVVSRSVPLPWQVVDLSGLDEDLQRRAMDDYIAADEAAGADFAASTLARVTVVRLGERRHELLWSYHHLLLDGWSSPSVIGEVLQAYQELVAGRQPTFPDRRPFRDFVAWLAAQDQDEAKQYWRDHLAGFTEPTSLDIGHETGQTGRGTAWTRLPADTTTRIAEFARRHRLTVNTVLQGAWALLTSRYSGTDDVVFGVTSSGRSGQLDGIEDMVGFLMNTTPARIKVDAGQSVPEWLASVQAGQARGRRFEHTTLTDIQACSQVAAGQPLFETLFIFENYPAPAMSGDDESPSADGLRAGTVFHGRPQGNYPLTVAAGIGPGPELSVRLDYERTRFEPAAMERLAEHLATILEAIAADTGRKVADLPVLTSAERTRVVGGWNDTVAPVPGVGGVHELVAEQVAKSPDAVAVVCGGVSVTYASLWERSGRLAGLLRSAGAGPETVVGLCLDRGIDMVTAVLGTWRAGAAYLPLDPGYPPERLAFMLSDSRAPVLVSKTELAEDLPAGRLRVLCLDDRTDAALLAATPSEMDPVAVDQTGLAYVMYTSGSTGTPKGVQVAHGGVLALAVAQRRLFGVSPGDRLLGFASFSFDASVWELVMALSSGGVLVVASAQERAEAGRVAELVTAAGVNVATLPPSLLHALGAAAPAGEPARELAGVSTLVTAGERLDEGLAATWSTDRRLFNAYGPTETTVCASAGQCLPGDGAPIGEPIANTTVYVLDQSLGLVPIGVTGELFVGGAQVARGYGGRPALTAERFIPDPFAADGSRMYRTGDRVRWRADGRLEFLSRADDQVKVRGFRIEPGEVEAVLAAHPHVRAAVVTAWGDGTAARLAAYLVPADPAEGIPAADALREFAARRLPEHMIPAVFTELAALPLTPAGKVDRAALPAPDESRLDAGRYVPPATAAEGLLAGIWAEVLGVERVGAEDNFFDLGGHSLLAIQVTFRVRDVFGIEIPFSAPFDRPTLRELAELVEGDQAGTATSPVTPVGRDEPLPLSFGQQRLWFVDQLEPGSAEFVVPTQIRLGPDLDQAALGAALDAVTARHEILRTRLVAGADGVPHQVIDPPGTVPLPVIDLSGLAEPARTAQQLIAQDAELAVDLAAGPMVRASLYRLDPAEHLLVLTMHHVSYDEWSDQIFRRELTALYEAFRAGEPDPLPPLPVQYADFAAWQRSALTGETLDGQLAYWREQLAEAPMLELPTDRPRPPEPSRAGAVLGFRVPVSVAEGLRAVAGDNDASMFMTLLAAYSIVLGRYSGQDDIVVGTPVAGRNRAETEDLIGFFVNTLVMRTDLSGDPGFGELLGRVRDMSLAAYANQDLPFEQLVDALVTDRDSDTPFFRVLFNYAPGDRRLTRQATPAEESADGPEVELEDFEIDVNTRFDVRLAMSDDADGGLSGGIHYSAELFDPATIRRLAGHLLTVMSAVVSDASAPVSRLPLLTAAERTQVLDGWNDTDVTWPDAEGVHELVTARAAETPDAIAVVDGRRSLSYAALMERAGRLAAYLRTTGAGPDTVVGLCLPRGADLVTAVLAVWQAGGAYLPLDPDYPPERLAYMLTDSRAAVLVGTAAVVEDLPVRRVRVVALDDPSVRRALAASTAPEPVAARRPDSLAYVIYTSGSTGTPKGVMVGHGALVNYVRWFNERFAVTGSDRVLVSSSPSFDAFGIELYPGLAAGGSLVIAPASTVAADADALIKTMTAQQVTVLPTVPAMLGLLTARAALAGCSTLRQVVCGGEQLTGRAAAALTGLLPVKLHNVYGPTEATIDVTSYTHDPDADRPDAAVPIGAPAANTRLYVLGRDLSPLPPGVPGELFIGGTNLARGYARAPMLTAARFVADPFGTGGGRLYRTGDRVRWNESGNLEFLGRLDDQVKVRGFRIEPGEIEAALAAHPGVRSAVVAVVGDGDSARLAAYLTPSTAGEPIPSVADLREHLRRRVPDFMIPAAFTELADLPLTPTGKVDRAALPDPDQAGPQPVHRYVAPATRTEELLTGIWAEVLGRTQIGTRDNFFELGGHSLLATQIVSRIRDAFGVEMPVTAMFHEPTIAETAAAIDKATPAAVGGAEGYEEFEL